MNFKLSQQRVQSINFVQIRRAYFRRWIMFRTGILHFAATGDMSHLPDKVEMPPVKWIIPVLAKKEKSKSIGHSP